MSKESLNLPKTAFSMKANSQINKRKTKKPRMKKKTVIDMIN